MKNNQKYFLTEEIKENIIFDYINNLYSIMNIVKKYNIKNKQLIRKIIGDNIRSNSESSKVGHIKYPNKSKHTEESKEKIRIKRLEYIKNNPNNTAWRLSNFSLPEKCFYNILCENGIDKKFLIVREYSFYPFFIDFAFLDIKVAVEIDGSQHLLPDRLSKDKEKDRLLLENGWSVIRFTSDDVINNSNLILSKLNEVFENNNQVYEKVGILKYKSLGYKKVERNNGSYTKKEIDRFTSSRKVKERPSLEQLFVDFEELKTFKKVATKYNVSDNTIRKWFLYYNIDPKKIKK